MLSLFLAMLVVVNGQSCLRANNAHGLPPFMDYRGSDLRSDTIPELHQAIIPSYRFTCCGNITEWGVDVHPGGFGHDRIYTLDLQVWRPSPTVQTTGCYSLVGNNRFTSISLANQVAIVTPLSRSRIEFQPGDVLGFMLENIDGSDGGVVLLSDSLEQVDGGYETEEIWYADFSNPVFNNNECQLAVGTGRLLNTRTNAAPVISISYSTVSCRSSITPTTYPVPNKPTLADMSHSDPPVTNLSEVTDPVLNQSDAEETPPYHNSGFLSNRSNIGLTVGVIIAALVVAIIITLAVVFGFVRHMKNQKNEVPMATNEAYGTGLQDMITYTEGDTYDYPSVNDQAKSFIDTKINEAYATNAEAKPCIAYATGVETKPCVAYATNIIADRNDTYDIKLRDVAMQREGDTYD